MTDSRLDTLESDIAERARVLEELNDVIARQPGPFDPPPRHY